MSDQPEKSQPTEKMVAQTQVVLANLRDPVMEALLQGRETSFSSQSKRTSNGLEITTTNEQTKEKSGLVVAGNVNSSEFLGGLSLVGDYNVKHLDGKGNLKSQEQDKFELKGSMFDAWSGNSDQFNAQLTRSDSKGHPFQVYKPAKSEVQYDGRNMVLDPNGQGLRIAKYAGSDNNCGMENPYNSANKRYECDYVISKGKDAPAKDGVSYNEVRENLPGGIYLRSVVRDGSGKVLGIVNQSYRLDANGDPVDIRTSARKPEQMKK